MDKNGTVDGSEIWRSPVEVGSLSLIIYKVRFIHPRWLRISSIHGISKQTQPMPLLRLLYQELSNETETGTFLK